MTKVFRAVLGLWVAPDFTAVMEGRAEPPRTNHSLVNFEELVTTLKQLFPYGPPVRLRVANDTIDQVTIHHRSGDVQLAEAPAGDMRCEDFGYALLKTAGQQAGDVINVRPAWQSLHAYTDRDFAPPPVLIPFVIEAVDFEDAMIWHASARPRLGLEFLPDALQAIAGKGKGDPNQEGLLPKEFRERLGRIFDCDFMPSALLGRMAMDKPPTAYNL